jgi:hypothetical protein
MIALGEPTTPDGQLAEDVPDWLPDEDELESEDDPDVDDEDDPDEEPPLKPPDDVLLGAM